MAIPAHVLAARRCARRRWPLAALAQEHDTPQPRRRTSGRSRDRSANSDQAQLQRGLQGLSRGLPGLSRPDAGRVPHAGGSRAAPASRPRRLRRSPPNTRSGPSPTTRARSSLAPAGSPTTPGAVPQRAGGACALQRRAAGPVGDRQGARLRARLPRWVARHVHAVPGARRRLHHGAARRAMRTGRPRASTLPPAISTASIFPATASRCRRR